MSPGGAADPLANIVQLGLIKTQPLGDLQVRLVLLVPHQLLNNLHTQVSIASREFAIVLTSISPSVRRSLVGKREFLRISPPSQDFSTRFARSVMDLAPPNPSRLMPFSEPSGDLDDKIITLLPTQRMPFQTHLVSIFLILLGGPSRSSPGLLPQSS